MAVYIYIYHIERGCISEWSGHIVNILLLDLFMHYALNCLLDLLFLYKE